MIEALRLQGSELHEEFMRSKAEQQNGEAGPSCAHLELTLCAGRRAIHQHGGGLSGTDVPHYFFARHAWMSHSSEVAILGDTTKEFVPGGD